MGNLLSKHLPLRAYVVTTGIAWTLLIAIIIGLSCWQEYQQMLTLARVDALSNLNKDLVYRRWASNHGGVYVPVTEDTQPNPYLQVPNRDVITTGGLALTLMNPAYMTRQVHELGLEQYGPQGHITSLNPLRPENAPDEWETQSLLSFEQDVESVSSVEIVDGKKVLRMMIPMVAEESCLTCHGFQGYKLGEIRGGLAVKIPMQPYEDIYNHASRQIIGQYAGVWLVGILGLAFANTNIRRQITKQKLAETKLRESEAKFRSLAENSQDYIIRYDRDGRHLYENPAALKISGLTEADIIGKTHREAGFSEDLSSLWETNIQSVANSGEQSQTVFKWQSARGEVFLDWRLYPEKDANGNIQSILGISRDVTEQKNYEQKLQNALAEKEVLLRELYHRTKNNMQLITSMLSLKAANTTDPQMESILQDVEGKIRAMALVHQHLYTSGNLSRIDLKEYINDLAYLLLDSYATRTRTVELKLELESVFVLIDTAIPGGLIINELVINAFKHAFPDGRNGTITIKLSQSTDGTIHLDISDDGIGVPDGFNFDECQTLGIQTTLGLARHQLGGEATPETTQGVAWHITFKETGYSERV